jgi:hypothetical protein
VLSNFSKILRRNVILLKQSFRRSCSPAWEESP